MNKSLPAEDLEFIKNETAHLWTEMKASSIFITGGTGFFGKWLVESFLHINESLQLGAYLTILSRNPTVFLNDNPYLKKYNNLSFIKGDIVNPIKSDKVFHYIIHAATPADAVINTNNPGMMLDCIILGTKNVLAFAKTQPVKSILYVSSGAIYGKQPGSILQIKETDGFFLDIINPLSAYAEGKRISELLCAIYAKENNVNLKIARCFSFVGPHLPLDKHFAIGNFILNVLHNNDIVVNGDGTPFRSYLYAADLTVWLWTILIAGENNVAYNVGSDEAFTIMQIAKKVAGYKNNVQVKIKHEPSNHYSTNRYIPSLENARLIGLKVSVGIDEAIKKTIRFYE